MHDHNDSIKSDEVPLRSWDEFPPGADEWDELSESDGVSRRSFLQRMSAAIALAGLGTAGCSDRPENEKLVPYVNAPEGVVPGKPIVFASTMTLNGFGTGVLVTSREGRPIKVEGNPDHPASLGGSNVFLQASILDLYDPARAQTPTHAGAGTDWSTFWTAIQPRLNQLRDSGGVGLRILSGAITSPTLRAQIQEFQKQFPQARWHHYDPMSRSNSLAGTQAAFGRPLNVVYDFTKAKTIVSLDSDFLFDDPGSIRYARHFIDGRRVRKNRMEMSRLYVIESTLSITGSMADHRLSVKPSRVRDLARTLAQACGVTGAGTGADSQHAGWLGAVANDLLANRGASLIVAGAGQPAAVHALAAAMNHALGNVGQTVFYTEPLESGAGDPERSLAALTRDIIDNRVSTLLIFGDNPAFNCPADVPFADALRSLSTARQPDGSLTNFTAHLSLYANETSFLSQWHLPETHYLESWGDTRAYDGTTSIVQPLISPLYSGRSIVEVVGRLLGDIQPNSYQIVRGHWQRQVGADFENWWNRTLKAGVIPNSSAGFVNVGAPMLPGDVTAPSTAPSGGLEVVIRPDYSMWDGTFSRNAWLRECPRPFTKLVWDNCALMHPKTAANLELKNGDRIGLTVRGKRMEAPAYILPGVPENAITMHLGYGHGQRPRPPLDVEAVEAHGFNGYLIRFSDSPGFGEVTIDKTGREFPLVATRSHHAMGGYEMPESTLQRNIEPNAVLTPETPHMEMETNNRRLVRVVSLPQFKENQNIVRDLGGEREKRKTLTLYEPNWDYTKGYQWAMSIDQSACIGCNACVVACQAENNTPVVGKEEVGRGREMHWLRIDDYFTGNPDTDRVVHQPVPCMHCENAPCEYVCPVGATTHSEEGLNQMTYNRCVGTRYCSNNCPYKVRRFNFFDYSKDRETPQRQLQQNPEVTVRTRGVMEKCTYCIQRIQKTRIEAEVMLVNLNERILATKDESEKKRLQEEAAEREFDILGRLQTACQQACPTQAIVFGSKNPVAGKRMPVMDLKDEPLNYSLLHELTTIPRTTYMARVTNPNPAIKNEGGRA